MKDAVASVWIWLKVQTKTEMGSLFLRTIVMTTMITSIHLLMRFAMASTMIVMEKSTVNTRWYNIPSGYRHGDGYGNEACSLPESNLIISVDDNGVEGGVFEECDEENNQIRIDDLCGEDD